MGFNPGTQGWLNTCINKSNPLHNRMKDKLYMIISIDTEKALGKIQHPFLLESLNNLAIERMHFKIIKVRYD